ncbi:glycoprotein 3-alpha-L-fucosyltransferase A-like [Culicoides brevitarsis]|uniref:glycoprotein 3-alpha-L-fucosyltransferase A-like n=1 Tax=Culicoides brevitarsis TaxID=469753 RepID=UPI00307B70D2
MQQENDKSVKVIETFVDQKIEESKPAEKQIIRRKLYFFKDKSDLYKDIDPNNLPLLPKEDPIGDRVVNQLLYAPPDYENYSKNLSVDKYKQIYYYDKMWGGFLRYGTEKFKSCLVFTCNITDNIENADLVVFFRSNATARSHPDQLQMFFTMESPLHFNRFPRNSFDLTSTYKRDSDIVADYSTWLYYDDRIKKLPQTTNYAEGKTKKVAWFVSNCNAHNDRLKFALELQKYIQVDIYGPCGGSKLSCPRSKQQECLQMLRKDYKFYLSFENSNCRDYITEKAFSTALKHQVLPIVMGARPEDYQRYMPERSFIHVDEFQSVQSLAAYLNLLDQDDVLYNSYFEWIGTGEILTDQLMFCRLCGMLHNPDLDRSKFSLSDKSIVEFWNGEGICNRENWKLKKTTQVVHFHTSKFYNF